MPEFFLLFIINIIPRENQLSWSHTPFSNIVMHSRIEMKRMEGNGQSKNDMCCTIKYMAEIWDEGSNLVREL